jgi:DNA-directed RNA polymerase specialized sigma24 family protein
MAITQPKKKWTLSASAFQRLLSWLDCGVDSGGESYLIMRERLLAYFDRKNCRAPDDLVDETLNRVARRLEEENEIQSDTPARYCYITARFVFMEYLREVDRTENAIEQMQLINDYEKLLTDEAAAEKEGRYECMEKCLNQLDSENRQIITRYYVGQARTKIDNRRALAQSLGMTINALSIRACRTRSKLEKCTRECLGDG